MRAKKHKRPSQSNLPNAPTANPSDGKRPSSADAENFNLPKIPRADVESSIVDQ